MYCRICGDEEKLSQIIRFWQPDDGWVAGRLCRSCYQDYGTRKPKPTDYAYNSRKVIFLDEDDAIVQIYG